MRHFFRFRRLPKNTDTSWSDISKPGNYQLLVRLHALGVDRLGAQIAEFFSTTGRAPASSRTNTPLLARLEGLSGRLGALSARLGAPLQGLLDRFGAQIAEFFSTTGRAPARTRKTNFC